MHNMLPYLRFVVKASCLVFLFMFLKGCGRGHYPHLKTVPKVQVPELKFKDAPQYVLDLQEKRDEALEKTKTIKKEEI
jgi:hypothetical protein